MQNFNAMAFLSHFFVFPFLTSLKNIYIYMFLFKTVFIFWNDFAAIASGWEQPGRNNNG
jgi:hypothetical protein